MVMSESKKVRYDASEIDNKSLTKIDPLNDILEIQYIGKVGVLNQKGKNDQVRQFLVRK